MYVDTTLKLGNNTLPVVAVVHKHSYWPVRELVRQITVKIRKEYIDKRPYAALLLLEGCITELCAHRPSDFNHVR